MIRLLTFFLAIAGFGSSPALAQNKKVLELGKQTYSACALCHGTDGKGARAGDIVMAPSLVESSFVKADSAEAMVAVILKGIAKEDNKWLQQMVPLEAALNDEQLAAVATFVRHEFGDKTDTTKPGDTKKWRAKYQSYSRPWKRSELEGVLKRIEAGPLLTNVKYSVYEGSWSKLPDFSTMEPVLRGDVKGKLSLDVADGRKDNFGIIFEGNLNIPTTDEYEFSLHSDDGSALVIDGEGIIDNDGIHPGTTKKATEKLEAGTHTFKILYFEKSGQQEFGFMVKAKSIGEYNLSKRSVNRGKKKSYPPIILNPENGEAIVHRTFLQGAKPRAIAVGYPGGINLAWNADTLNLDFVWRGDFIDASPHWNGRGSGSRPAGGPTIKPGEGLPLQQLESLDEKWIAFSESTIKYERDTPDPQKDTKFNIKHPDFQFTGYRLDKKRYPTFRYTYRNLTVTDYFAPTKIDGRDALVRTVTFEGEKVPADLYYRVSDKSPGKPESSDSAWISLGDLSVKIEGTEPTFRQTNGKEVLAHIKEPSTVTITYRWNQPRSVK